jgi:chromosome segregation ATPase
MAKKTTEKHNIEKINELLSKIKNDDGSKTIIKICDKKISNKEMADRYKKSTNQSREKIKKINCEILLQKAKIKELELKEQLHVDSNVEKINKKLSEEKKWLKAKLSEEKKWLKAKLSEEKKDIKQCKLYISELKVEKKQKDDEILELKNEIAELKNEIAELKNEIAAWIKEDNKFKRLDI